MKYLFFLLVFISIKTFSQDDLIALVNTDSSRKGFVTGAFKSSRIINGHSIEMIGKGVLDFRILHRFGTLQNGIKDMFGLDDANIRLGFDYGITNNLTVGIGRSGFNKELDGFIKYRLVQQSSGAGSFPFSIVWISGMTVKTMDWTDNLEHDFSDRLAYYHMVAIGRKFSRNLSLQVSPTFVHRGFVYSNEENNSFALGLGGRYKFTKRLAFMVDYHYVFSGIDKDINTNPLSVGIDIETGGHVFQLHFSNSTGMNEKAFLTETNGKWDNGEIRFGFNLSRVFNISRSAKQKNW
jgi:hypothetical protein